MREIAERLERSTGTPFNVIKKHNISVNRTGTFSICFGFCCVCVGGLKFNPQTQTLTQLLTNTHSPPHSYTPLHTLLLHIHTSAQFRRMIVRKEYMSSNSNETGLVMCHNLLFLCSSCSTVGTEDRGLRHQRLTVIARYQYHLSCDDLLRHRVRNC